MKVTEHDWQRYRARAAELGFVAMAAAPRQPIGPRADVVRDWVARGFDAGMAWFARSLEKRLDLGRVMAEAATVIVLLTPYEKQSCSLAGKKLARYACGDDYHDVLKKKLWRLCDGIGLDYAGAQFRPYVDTGPILERHWAERAGLGWIGKNGNLINRQWGSYVFIACIVTDLDVPVGEPHAPFCGNCRACIDACPTDAIVAEGVVDSNRCISYLNIEHRGPFENAPDFADWIFGCDICQEVCPWTVKFAREPVIDVFQARPEYETLNDAELAGMKPEAFSRTFRKSAIKRTKLAGLQRNLAHLDSD